MKMDKFTAFKQFGNIDKTYVMEADNAYAAAKETSQAREKPSRRLLDWLNRGWGAAVICLLVAGGILAGIIYAGNASEDPTGPAGQLPDDIYGTQTSPGKDGAETSDTEAFTQRESSLDHPLSGIELVLALAPKMEVPEGTVKYSDTAFYTRVYLDGIYTRKVMRMMIVCSLENDNNRWLTLELLEDDGSVLESHTLVMPNYGILLYILHDPNANSNPMGGPADSFVFIGYQFNNTFTASGEIPVPNVEIFHTYLSWHETEGKDSILQIKDHNRAFGKGAAWDADFVQALQAELDTYMPEYMTYIHSLAENSVFIASEDDCFEPDSKNMLRDVDLENFSLDAMTMRELAYAFFLAEEPPILPEVPASDTD